MCLTQESAGSFSENLTVHSKLHGNVPGFRPSHSAGVTHLSHLHTSCPILPPCLCLQVSEPITLCIYRKNAVELQIGVTVYFLQLVSALIIGSIMILSLNSPRIPHPSPDPGQLCLLEGRNSIKLAQVSSVYWTHLFSGNLPHLPGYTPSSHSTLAGDRSCTFYRPLSHYLAFISSEDALGLFSHLPPRLPS